MKLQGTVELVRELEETIELARTRGNVVIGKEAKKEHPVQGKELESAAFSRTYEVYANEDVRGWETSSRSFLKLVLSSPTKIRFWYEYRDGDNRKGTATVKISNGDGVKSLFKLIPGFRQALNNLRRIG
jgi:hypothetical protein